MFLLLLRFAAYGAGGGQSVPSSSASRVSIAGLVFGVLTFLQCCPAFAVLGLILSITGYVQAPPESGWRSKRLALIGIILSIVGVAIHLMLIKLGAFDRLMEEVRGLRR